MTGPGRATMRSWTLHLVLLVLAIAYPLVFTGNFAVNFGVLVLLFGSVAQPVTILLSLPLSFGGVVLALLATNNSVSMPVYIGLLMLMGIVTKNALVARDTDILGDMARRNLAEVFLSITTLDRALARDGTRRRHDRRRRRR